VITILQHLLVVLVISAFMLLLGAPGALDLCAVHAKDAPADLGSYEVIVDKDLFDPDRGVTEEEASDEDTASPGEELNKKYQVYGAIIAGEMRQAFVKVVEEQKPVRRPSRKRSYKKDEELRTVTVGDLMDGWRVAEITPDGVEFTGRGERVHLGIFDVAKADRKATAPVAIQTPQPEPEQPPSPGPIGGVESPVGAAGGPTAQKPAAQGRPPLRHAPGAARPAVQQTPPFEPVSESADAGSPQTVQSIFGGGLSQQQQQEVDGSEPGAAPVLKPASKGNMPAGSNPFLELLKRKQ
jgi:hypothetical protein